MNLPKLNGPHLMEAERIRTSILRFIEHTEHIQIVGIRRKIRKVTDFVETRLDTAWFIKNQSLTRDCDSALGAVTRIGEENKLF